MTAARPAGPLSVLADPAGPAAAGKATIVIGEAQASALPWSNQAIRCNSTSTARQLS